MEVYKRIASDWKQEQSAYRDPDKPFGWQWGADVVYEQMTEIAGPYIGGTVMEIGCGGGKWTKWLFEMGAEEVIAMDVHSEAIRQAKLYEPRAQYWQINGNSFPNNAPVVDLVFTWDVLLHLPRSLVYQYIEGAWVKADAMLFGFPDLKTKCAQAQFKGNLFQEPYTLGYMEYYTLDFAQELAFMAGWKKFEYLGHIGSPERDFVAYASK